jgi:hypothetical protein
MEMLDVCSMFLGTPGVSPLETDFISVIWERLILGSIGDYRFFSSLAHPG